ncbi:MAG: hypothetical protein KA735_06685 [Burkholderiaceae bacterium]|nr:hypothetical protein [Burkholderiaceae bacterium]
MTQEHLASLSVSNPTRRRLLGSLLTAYTATLVPWALAQPIKDDQHGAFVALSAILVGRQSLDSDHAQRLYSAFVEKFPNFPATVSALLKLINTKQISPMVLQKTLDAGHPELAALPRSIATAWIVGVVGDGNDALCLAYETALMSDIVKDKLNPPSYAYGAYGSWESNPN